MGRRQRNSPEAGRDRGARGAEPAGWKRRVRGTGASVVRGAGGGMSRFGADTFHVPQSPQETPITDKPEGKDIILFASLLYSSQ